MYSLAAAVSVSAKIGKQLKSSWSASDDADEDAEEDDDEDADEDDEDGDEDADEDDEDTNNSVSAMSARCVAEGGCLRMGEGCDVPAEHLVRGGCLSADLALFGYDFLAAFSRRTLLAVAKRTFSISSHCCCSRSVWTWVANSSSVASTISSLSSGMVGAGPNIIHMYIKPLSMVNIQGRGALYVLVVLLGGILDRCSEFNSRRRPIWPVMLRSGVGPLPGRSPTRNRYGCGKTSIFLNIQAQRLNSPALKWWMV